MQPVPARGQRVPPYRNTISFHELYCISTLGAGNEHGRVLMGYDIVLRYATATEGRSQMRRLLLDPTAGERARALRTSPALPLRILDPTDIRFGAFPLADHALSDAGRVLDPTDPEYGRTRPEPPVA